MTSEFTTIADVENIAARLGIELTPDDYAAAYAVMEKRREIEAQTSEKTQAAGKTWVDAFNRWYPRLLRALHGIGDVSIMLVQTALVGPFLLLLLVLLMAVEHQRTVHGLMLFESNPALASFGAAVLVLLNLTLELLIGWVEHRAGWVESARHDFSLRLLWQRGAYILGRASDWKPRAKSPAIGFRAILRIVTISILILATAGSMTAIIARAQGTWRDAIGVILNESTLLEAVTWASGLLFSVSAVISAQALSRYAARKSVEIGAALTSGDGDRTRAALQSAGMSGAAVLFARLKDRQRAARRAGVALASEMPDMGVTGAVRISTISDRPQLSQDTGQKPTGQGAQTEGMLSPAVTLPPTVRKALKWLQDHPETAGLTVRELAAAAGVSRTTMHRALMANEGKYQPRKD